MGAATVVAAHLPTARSPEAPVIAFRPPRTTVLLATAPETLAHAIAELAAEHATVLLDARPDALPALAADLRRRLPDADLLGYSPRETLRFLWHFRDHEDPLTLGHASDREFLNSAFVAAKVPDHRAAKGRREKRRAVEAIRELVLDMGYALGAAPPLPEAAPAPGGWGPVRLGAVMDASAGLFAGLLLRWGAPIAARRPGTPLATAQLADRWLRTHSPVGE